MRTLKYTLGAILCALALYGASCDDTGGNERDTGLDRAGGANAEKPEVTDFEPRKFSGNGSTNIGTVKVPGDAIFEWTNSDDPAFRTFSAYDADFQLGVSSEAESGESVMPAGTYPNIDVYGGDWTITIRPR